MASPFAFRVVRVRFGNRITIGVAGLVGTFEQGSNVRALPGDIDRYEFPGLLSPDSFPILLNAPGCSLLWEDFSSVANFDSSRCGIVGAVEYGNEHLGVTKPGLAVRPGLAP